MLCPSVNYHPNITHMAGRVRNLCEIRRDYESLAGSYSPPTKTIGHARAGAETELTIHSLGNDCHHQAVKTLEELKLWNDMIFVDVPKHRHLVCSMRKPKREGDADLFPAARGTPGFRREPWWRLGIKCSKKAS
jgi:hypothetical protein